MSTTTTTNGPTTPGTSEHPVKTIKRTKNLSTALTQKEKGEKGELVAHLVQRIVERREARKNAGAQLKSEIDQLEAELKTVSLEISCGQVFRDVQILEKHIYRTGMYQEVRCDNGEVILERALTEKERQTELPLDAETDGGGGDDFDDLGDIGNGGGPTNWTPDETEEPEGPANGSDFSPTNEDKKPEPAPRKGNGGASKAKAKGKGKR